MFDQKNSASSSFFVLSMFLLCLINIGALCIYAFMAYQGKLIAWVLASDITHLCSYLIVGGFGFISACTWLPHLRKPHSSKMKVITLFSILACGAVFSIGIYSIGAYPYKVEADWYKISSTFLFLILWYSLNRVGENKIVTHK